MNPKLNFFIATIYILVTSLYISKVSIKLETFEVLFERPVQGLTFFIVQLSLLILIKIKYEANI